MEIPDPRQMLIDDFRLALEQSGEFPDRIDYILRDDNIEKLSDDEIGVFIKKYQSIGARKKNADSDMRRFADAVKSELPNLIEMGKAYNAEFLASLRAKDAAKKKSFEQSQGQGEDRDGNGNG